MTLKRRRVSSDLAPPSAVCAGTGVPGPVPLWAWLLLPSVGSRWSLEYGRVTVPFILPFLTDLICLQTGKPLTCFQKTDRIRYMQTSVPPHAPCRRFSGPPSLGACAPQCSAVSPVLLEVRLQVHPGEGTQGRRCRPAAHSLPWTELGAARVSVPLGFMSDARTRGTARFPISLWRFCGVRVQICVGRVRAPYV